MPIKHLKSLPDRVEVAFRGAPVAIRYTTLAGGVGSARQRDGLKAALELLAEQAGYIRRQNVDDLPLDDPDKTATDAELAAEYGEKLIKERAGPTTYLVSRGVIFDDPTWDGERWICPIRKPDGPA